jgi:hypothetical protein
MKIYKTKQAGVHDFMRGVTEYDLDSLPPEEELTDDQKEFVWKKSLHINDSCLRAKFFYRFPKHSYFSIYDINQVITWKCMNNDQIGELWRKYVAKGDDLKYSPPTGLWFDMYMDIARGDRIKVTEAAAGETFANATRYPKEFIEALSKKFPDIYAAASETDINDRIQLVKNFIAMPTLAYYKISLPSLRNTVSMSTILSIGETTRKEHWTMRETVAFLT